MVKTVKFKIKKVPSSPILERKGQIELFSRSSIFKHNNAKIQKIELLAPSGSLACLKAAISSGADSVYLGMNKFNARENAVNFNSKYLIDAIHLAKSNDVRVYLTANTLIKNSEIAEFLEQIKYGYEHGIDAVIIQDPSFIEIIKKSFPGLEVHLSTQTGIMNSAQANLFDVDRIILAREIDKKNLELLRKNCKIGLEMFVHGALCACVSGSCLFSSLLGGRSGNRGKCAQPCRKVYNSSLLISTKELCLVEKIPEIIKLGINAVKIEGRMRTPYYVATSVSNYRKAIDSYYARKFKVTPEMKKQLESGFTRGFTEGRFSSEDIFNARQSTGTSKIVEKVYEVISRFIKPKKRIAKIQLAEVKEKNSSGKKLIARVYSEKDALVADNYADIICLDMFNKDFEKIKELVSKPLYAVTPRIMFDEDIIKIKDKLQDLNSDGLLIGNIGILSFPISSKIPIVFDYNVNCFNDLQLNYYGKFGKAIISPELSSLELEKFKNKDFIAFVHGKIRLMTLAHEIKEGKMRDERGFNFNINKIYNGAEITNEKELGLFNKLRSLLHSGINQFYIDTEENLEEILKVYRAIIDGKSLDVSELQKKYVLGWSKQGVL